MDRKKVSKDHASDEIKDTSKYGRDVERGLLVPSSPKPSVSSIVTVKVALEVLVAALLLLGVIELAEYNSGRQQAAGLGPSPDDPANKPAASATKQVHASNSVQARDLQKMYGNLAKVRLWSAACRLASAMHACAVHPCSCTFAPQQINTCNIWHPFLSCSFCMQPKTCIVA